MPVATDSHIRDQLKQIRDQKADLRQRLNEAKKEQDAAKEALKPLFEAAEGKVDFDSPEFKAAEKTVQTVGDLRDEIETHNQSEAALLRLIGDNTPVETGNDRPPAVQPSLARGWDAHQMLASSETYQDARDRGLFHSKSRLGGVEIGQLASREETASFLRSRTLAAEIPGAPAGVVGSEGMGSLIRRDERGLQPLRLPTLLDIFPSGTTNAPSIDYVQITGVPDGADVVAEGEIKPEVGLTVTDESARAVTIAGWIKVLRQAMDDTDGLAAMINTLLPHDVRRKVVDQILNGDGTGQNMRGLYHTTGVAEPDAVAGDNTADAFLRAITTVLLSDGEPNFAALNPITWQDLLLMKNSNGNYIYGAPGTLPGGTAAQTVWGLTLTTNRMIPQDKPIVGDSMGAMIFVREGVNVRTSDADQDDFVRNRVTILAETRVAFAVWRPSDFAIVNLGGGTGNGSGGDA